jgi:hypothetical protein
MGVAVEGSEKSWPGEETAAVLPESDNFNRQERYIEVFNKSKEPFEYSVTTDDPWIILSHTGGSITDEQRVGVSIDWSLLPYGRHAGKIRVSGTGIEVPVSISAFNPALPQAAIMKGFIEADGYVSIEAEHYTAANKTGERYWERIEDYGHTISAMRATTVTDAPPAIPGKDSPSLEYMMYLFSTGNFEITLRLAPTLNFIPGRDLRIGVSFDDDTPQILTVVPKEFNAQNGNKEWENTVMDNARFVKAELSVREAGYHTLKVWMIDPGVVLEKIVLDTGGVKPSYLGPPESYRNF